MRICVVRQDDNFLGGASLYDEALVELVCETLGPSNQILQAIPKRCFTRSNKEFLRYRLSYVTLISIYLSKSKIFSNILKRINLNNISFEKKLKKNEIDFVIFTFPSILALGLRETPFAVPVWDLGHRDLPEFYETSLNGNFENREYYFSAVLPKASLVLTDSEVTRQRIIKLYGVKSENVINLGFLWMLQYRNNKVEKFDHKFRNQDFFIYPANFWAHKNHELLIDVFSHPDVHSKKIGLIFTGQDRGNEIKLKKIVIERGLQDTVLFLGVIDIEKLNFLYSSCLALLFPSLLGPSNIPPLEAWYYGKVSIISNMHTSEEFTTNNFIKLDPFDVSAWVDKIINLTKFNVPDISELVLDHDFIKFLIKKSIDKIALKRKIINW